MHKNNIISGFVFCFVFLMLIILTKNTLPERIHSYPQLVGYVGVFVSSLLIIVSGVKLLREKGIDLEVKKLNKREVLRVGELIALLTVYVFIITSIGYLVTTAIFMFIVMCVMNKENNTRRSYLIHLTISLLFSGLVYFVFTVFLNISMPTGILV